MNLQGIISVSGRPGLFKLMGQNKAGFVVEGLDAQKTKLVVNMSTSKMASLEDITIYGEGEDMKLQSVFEAMAKAPQVPDPKTDGTMLRNFFREVAPGHDEERVYASDIKKIISWFFLLKDLPLFSEEAAGEGKSVPVLEDAVKKSEALKAEKSKPVQQKAAGKGATRLPRKAS